MNLDEMLKCLITREETLLSELEKGGYRREVTKFPSFGVIEDVDRKPYFIVSHCIYPLIMSPNQMLSYIKHLNTRWYTEIQRMRKKALSKDLHEVILQWLQSHPRIRPEFINGLQNIGNSYLEFPDVQNDPFNIYKKHIEFENKSWINMMLVHFCQTKFIFWIEGCEQNILLERMNGAIHSRFDQMLIQFREELGVHSLKEIESLESAICYLLYREEWIDDRWERIADIQTRSKRYSLYMDYIKKNPNASQFDFFCTIGGFDGELWASYDEFMHDEWLDDSFADSIGDPDNQKLYKFIKKMA